MSADRMVFLTDEDVRIPGHNRAAAEFLGPNPEAVLRRLCGEAFRCINADSAPDGCGTGEECPDGVIRNAVKAAAEGQRPLRRHAELSLQRDGQICPIHLWVTVSPLEYNTERVFIVSLEDTTELVTLRQLLPVCSNCKRVLRNDGQYREQIDDYLRQHTNIEFTHSICPDCARILYADSSE